MDLVNIIIVAALIVILAISHFQKRKLVKDNNEKQKECKALEEELASLENEKNIKK